MNQRFHLLFLLVLVLVALASVAGVFLFAEAAAQNRRDAIVQRSLEFAARSQHWAAKPAIFGGGGGDFSGITIWKVTGQSGDSDWLAETQTFYRVDALPRPTHAHVTAIDKTLGLRVVVVLSGEEVVNTIIEHTAPPSTSTVYSAEAGL